MGMPYPYRKPYFIVDMLTRLLAGCGCTWRPELYGCWFFALFLLPPFAFCQPENHIQNPAFGVHYILNDFKSVQAIRATSLRLALRNNQFGRVSDMAQGLGLNYITGLNPHLDLSSTLTGSFPDYAVKNYTPAGKGSLLLELDASIRAKLFTNKRVVSPYLQSGIGVSCYSSYWDAFVPAGVGVQARILDEAFLIVNAQYRLGITDKASDHLFYSIGLAGNIGRKKPVAKAAVAVVLPPVLVDSDGDGITDSLDHCPLQKGMAIFSGCPDQDGDSIPDKDDKCPYTKGLRRYQGCPIPDTDADGIHDEADKCPTEKGEVAYQGCPAPDKDKDGVADETDKCPDLPGVIANEGCPDVPDEVKILVDHAAQNIFFATGSAVLLTRSYHSLDEVISLLRAYPDLQLTIEGHTDHIGRAGANQVLSEKRAKAVYAYLEKKGIAVVRMHYAGFGATKPVADNGTASGRSMNRRVVLTVSFEPWN